MKKLRTKVAAIGSSVVAMYFVALGYVQTAFAQNGQDINLLGNGQTIQPGTGYAANVGTLINSVLNFILVIAALLVLLYLVWGGIEWITSGGDKGKTEGARNKITSAVIGLIILAASYAIFTLVIRFLGFQNVNEIFDVRSIESLQ